MKKVFIFMICAALLMSFAACNEQDPEQAQTSGNATEQSAETPSTSEAKENKYFYSVTSANNFKLTADMDMDAVKTAIGEPLKYEESPSCAYDGLDKTYIYSGFAVNTRPENGKDLINSIKLTDDSTTTPEGIYVGADAASVKAAYGTPAEETETLITYKDDITILNFVLRDGMIISIEYLAVNG